MVTFIPIMGLSYHRRLLRASAPKKEGERSELGAERPNESPPLGVYGEGGAQAQERAVPPPENLQIAEKTRW
jgi:hypothetical protein